MAEQGYAGADWVKMAFKVELSPLGEAVANVLGDVFRGIYHLNTKLLRKVEWSSDTWVAVNLHYRDLATFDSDELTRLVVLCHDRMLRCDISAKAPHLIELGFSQRRSRTGSIVFRHPTLENAAQAIRQELFIPHLEVLSA